MTFTCLLKNLWAIFFGMKLFPRIIKQCSHNYDNKHKKDITNSLLISQLPSCFTRQVWLKNHEIWKILLWYTAQTFKQKLFINHQVKVLLVPTQSLLAYDDRKFSVTTEASSNIYWKSLHILFSVITVWCRCLFCTGRKKFS